MSKIDRLTSDQHHAVAKAMRNRVKAGRVADKIRRRMSEAMGRHLSYSLKIGKEFFD